MTDSPKWLSPPLKAVKIPARYAALTALQRRLVREEHARQQEGLCSHCKMPLSGPPAETVLRSRITACLFPPGFFRWPVHLHHSHITGMTLGAVHSRCNAVLFQYHGE